MVMMDEGDWTNSPKTREGFSVARKVLAVLDRPSGYQTLEQHYNVNMGATEK